MGTSRRRTFLEFGASLSRATIRRIHLVGLNVFLHECVNLSVRAGVSVCVYV